MVLFYLGDIGAANNRTKTLFYDTVSKQKFEFSMTIGYFYEVKRKLKDNYKNLRGGRDLKSDVENIFVDAELKSITELEDSLKELFKYGAYLYNKDNYIILVYRNSESDALELWMFDLELNMYEVFSVSNYSNKVDNLEVISCER